MTFPNSSPRFRSLRNAAAAFTTVGLLSIGTIAPFHFGLTNAAAQEAAPAPASAPNPVATASAQVVAVPGQVAIKDGESIGFMGDSITAGGAGSPSGYVRLVISGLKAIGRTVTPYPAGISGHKSNQMLARLDKDIIEKKPTWMTLSCGVNDVWHGPKGVPLPEYKENITKIIDKCQAAGIKVMILTSTMIREDGSTAENKKLAEYNDFLRALATEKKCLLADLNADMQKIVSEKKAAGQQGDTLTVDGVHMNPLGNIMMATGVLRAFGLSDEQMKTVNTSWDTVTTTVPASITLRDYKLLQDAAAKTKRNIGAVISDSVKVTPPAE
ncbi:MAG: SGNH/GDSL hydrolase family protein [Candidatus Methylacidiphilales bacterium]|nr:GDSL-type esterase/lipase family protein [Candidatus Methylacidiphilales bacterium]